MTYHISPVLCIKKSYSSLFFLPLTGWSISLNGAESKPLPAIEIEGMSATYVANSTPILIRITQGSKFTRYHLAYYSTDDTLEGTDREGKRRLLEKVEAYAAIVKGDVESHQSYALMDSSKNLGILELTFCLLHPIYIDSKDKESVQSGLEPMNIMNMSSLKFKKVKVKEAKNQWLGDHVVMMMKIQKILITGDKRLITKASYFTAAELVLILNQIQTTLKNLHQLPEAQDPLPPSSNPPDSSLIQGLIKVGLFILVLVGIARFLIYPSKGEEEGERSEEMKGSEERQRAFVI